MSKQDGKVFIGGLSWETTDEKLRRYFENYGTVQEAFVSYDRHTGRPRGFGFVVFADPVICDKVVAVQHTIDRREVEAKKALPKDESPVSKDQQAVASGQRTKKIFVGGLAATVDEAAFQEYFEEFGTVEDAVVMYDHENRRPRGFGFITFIEEEAVDQVFARGAMQTIHDKQIEIKRAVPRDSMSMSPSPRPMYRPPPGHYYEGQSPYYGRYGPRSDRGGYGTPHTGGDGGYHGGGRGRGGGDDGVGGRSPMPGGRGPMFSPPAVVTGIPATMAGTPGAAEAVLAATGSSAVVVVTPGAVGGNTTTTTTPTTTAATTTNNGMMAMTPQSPLPPPASPGMQSTPPRMVGGFSMSSGVSPSGGGGGGSSSQFAPVGSPPFSLDGQQQQQQATAAAAVAHNLAADLQQVSLGSVTGALEQLQVQQQQQQQAQQQQQQAQAQDAQQQQASTTTIWS